MAVSYKEIVPAGFKVPPNIDSEDKSPVVFLQLKPDVVMSFFHFPYEELVKELRDTGNRTNDNQLLVILRNAAGDMCFGKLTIKDKHYEWALKDYTDHSGNWHSLHK